MHSNNFLTYSFELFFFRITFNFPHHFVQHLEKITKSLDQTNHTTISFTLYKLNTFLALFIHYPFYILSLILRSYSQQQRNVKICKENHISEMIKLQKIRYLSNSTNKEWKYHANVTIKSMLRIARTPYIHFQ